MSCGTESASKQGSGSKSALRPTQNPCFCASTGTCDSGTGAVGGARERINYSASHCVNLRTKEGKPMPNKSKASPSVDEIAEMATRGEDVSGFFTNQFTMCAADAAGQRGSDAGTAS